MVFFIDYIAIKDLINKKNFNSNIAPYILLFREFNYKIEYKSRRLHNQVNHLLRLEEKWSPIPIDDNLVDESLFIISIHFT